MKFQATLLLSLFAAGGAMAQNVRVDGVPFAIPVYATGKTSPPRPEGMASNANSNSTASSTSQGVGSQGQSLSVDSHAVYQAQSRNPVASAVAPMLVSSNDTCMGSTSVGAQAVSFGLSFGHSWTDDNCLMLKNAREMWNMGYRGAALARMCMDERNRTALEATGVNCPAGRHAQRRNGGDSRLWD